MFAEAAGSAALEEVAGGAVTVKRSMGSADVSYSDRELASDSAALSSPACIANDGVRLCTQCDGLYFTCGIYSKQTQDTYSFHPAVSHACSNL